MLWKKAFRSFTNWYWNCYIFVHVRPVASFSGERRVVCVDCGPLRTEGPIVSVKHEQLPRMVQAHVLHPENFKHPQNEAFHAYHIWREVKDIIRTLFSRDNYCFFIVDWNKAWCSDGTVSDCTDNWYKMNKVIRHGRKPLIKVGYEVQNWYVNEAEII